jgi:hypothetical protein
MKTKAGAISSGCAARFSAVALPNFATCSACLSAGLSGVQTGPAAEECLKLANGTTQIYARLALLELAAEFREIADELERRSRPLVAPPTAAGAAETPRPAPA